MKRLASIMLSAAALATAAAPYRVTGEIPIGGQGGWDYLTVDSAARRLYVSHATKVVVLDLDAGKIAGEIPDTPGVHGIALAPALGRGFISAGRANQAVIFDLKTLKSLGQVKTGTNPDAILYDPASGRVFTFNGGSHDATAFDAKTGKVQATLPLGGKPEFSVTDGKATVYVNIEDTAEIAVIDSNKPAVRNWYKLAGCHAPSGLAIDTAHGRLFSVCENKVMAISDPVAGSVVATVPIGEGSDGAGFDPARGLAFSSNGGDGTLTVVGQRNGKYEAVATVPTQRGARTMAIDQQTHRIYLPSAEFGPPAPGQRRPVALPDTFTVLIVAE
jgi:DNA-binding beta-propeller fold protein YncE